MLRESSVQELCCSNFNDSSHDPHCIPSQIPTWLDARYFCQPASFSSYFDLFWIDTRVELRFPSLFCNNAKEQWSIGKRTSRRLRASTVRVAVAKKARQDRRQGQVASKASGFPIGYAFFLSFILSFSFFFFFFLIVWFHLSISSSSRVCKSGS